ncbi:hypothetical protein LTR40_013973, partial [Exophiala xenobiotica]
RHHGRCVLADGAPARPSVLDVALHCAGRTPQRRGRQVLGPSGDDPSRRAAGGGGRRRDARHGGQLHGVPGVQVHRRPGHGPHDRGGTGLRRRVHDRQQARHVARAVQHRPGHGECGGRGRLLGLVEVHAQQPGVADPHHLPDPAVFYPRVWRPPVPGVAALAPDPGPGGGGQSVVRLVLQQAFPGPPRHPSAGAGRPAPPGAGKTDGQG